MVLGSRARQSTRLSICRRESELVPEDHRTRLHHRRMPNVGRWSCVICGTAHILPPNARQHPSILSFTLQTEDNHSTFFTYPPFSALFVSV